MERRGQAALEFLTTYGWALLVILVMIGALVYFGVLNPTKVLPNRCEAEAGFSCQEFVLRQGSFDVSLLNKKGEALTDLSVNGTQSADFINAPATTDCEVRDSAGAVLTT